MAGGDRLLMEGHSGRTGSDVASCSRGIFYPDIKISWWEEIKNWRLPGVFKSGALRNLQSPAA